ncbi:hypothetical protein EU520_00915 [Candidatus Thorarchaeota archaeon]|nr:MAG: hypothetical protein EU520_00915 [Candidatus Thorarchaeota archaeon]
MTVVTRRRILVFFLVTSLVSMLCQPIPAEHVPLVNDEDKGPYLEQLDLHWTLGDANLVENLLSNEIDMMGDSIHIDSAAALEGAENIEIVKHLRNGYGYMTINCDKYPLNITAFRRAVAFAVDKEEICTDSWDGWAEPLDSLIPKMNPFSIEGDLPYSYYDSDMEMAGSLLDGAGFHDIDSDGFREAPDRSNLDVVVEWLQYTDVSVAICNAFADQLQALKINATAKSGWSDGLTRLYFHGDYDMMFLGESFTDLDITWMADEYWSENANESYYNFPNFRNTTYDSWREQLLYSTEYGEVYEAARQMQEIWIHACPVIVCYENYVPHAYRTDRFSGFVAEPLDSIGGWWTCLRTHLTRSGYGILGGTLRVGLPHTTPQFNIMIATGAASYDFPYLHLMYDSLLRRGPDGNDLSWLAKSYVVETHDDDSSVAEGTTRFTFDIRTDITWTDGSRLTASDIVCALNFYRISPGNPLGQGMSEIYAAYTLSSFRLVVEVSQVSYWGRYAFCFKPILPPSLLEDLAPEDWADWDPQPPEDRMVTSGPFNVSAVESEYLSLRHNPDYFARENFVPPRIESPPDTSITAGSTNHTVSWNCTDSDPFAYAVYRNGSLTAEGDWDGGLIEISLVDLGAGIYNFTCVVEDEVGLISSDTVWVRVESVEDVESSTGVIPPPDWLLPLGPVSLGITAIGLAIIFVVGSKTVKERRSVAMSKQTRLTLDLASN